MLTQVLSEHSATSVTHCQHLPLLRLSCTHLLQLQRGMIDSSCCQSTKSIEFITQGRTWLIQSRKPHFPPLGVFLSKHVWVVGSWSQQPWQVQPPLITRCLASQCGHAWITANCCQYWAGRVTACLSLGCRLRSKVGAHSVSAVSAVHLCAWLSGVLPHTCKLLS